MNSLLFLAHERNENIVCIKDPKRLSYLESAHVLQIGKKLKVAELYGARGDGFVIEKDQAKIILEINLCLPPLLPENISLFIAIPRPQTIKKCLWLAVQYGVKKVIFFKGANSQKSYLSSKSLDKENIEIEVFKALEQSFSSVPPVVEVVHHFSALLKHEALKENVVVCHTHSSGTLSNLSGDISLLIGPELGWSDAELESFRSLKSTFITLGERILRVEWAAAKALSIIKPFFSLLITLS